MRAHHKECVACAASIEKEPNTETLSDYSIIVKQFCVVVYLQVFLVGAFCTLVATIEIPNCSNSDSFVSFLSKLGSHNAITYCLDMNDRSPVDLTQPDMLQKLDKYMKPLIRPFVYKWAKTQVTDDRRRR